MCWGGGGKRKLTEEMNCVKKVKGGKARTELIAFFVDQKDAKVSTALANAACDGL